VRSVAGHIPFDLAACCHKALARSPEDRYESPQTLADDLQAFVRGGLVGAARYSLSQRLGKVAARNKKVVVGVALTVIVALVTLVLGAISYVTGLSAEKDRARDAETVALSRMSEARLAQAEALLAGDDPRGVRRLLSEAVTVQQGLGQSGLSARLALSVYFRQVPQPMLSVKLKEGAGTSIAVAEDCEFVASSRGSEIDIRDLTTGGVRAVLEGHQGDVIWIQTTSRRGYLGSLGDDRSFRIWDVKERKTVRRIELDQDYRTARLCRDGSRVFVGSKSGTMSCFDVETGERLASRAISDRPVYSIEALSDGSVAYVAMAHNQLFAWDVADDRVLWTETWNHGAEPQVLLTRDEKVLLDVSQDREIALIDPRTGESLRSHTGHPGSSCVALLGEGFVAGGRDGVLRVISTEDAQIVKLLHGHESQVVALSSCHDGRHLVSVDKSGLLNVWDRKHLELEEAWAAHEKGCVGLAFSHDGAWLATTGRDGWIRIWDAATHLLLKEIEAPDEPLCVAVSPDSSRLAVGCLDGSVCVWSLPEGRLERRVQADSRSCRCVEFSPDGTCLATGGGVGVVSVLDMGSGKWVQQWPAHRKMVWSVRWSHDGRQVASGSLDGSVRVWDVEKGGEVLTFRGIPGEWTPIYQVVFSEDDRRLWYSTWVGGAGRMSVGDGGNPANMLLRTGSPLLGLAVSEKSGLAATGAFDGSVALWQLPDLSPIRRIENRQLPAGCAAFSGNGWTLGVAGSDGVVSLRNLRLGEEYECREAQGELAADALRSRMRDPEALLQLARWYAFRQAWDVALACFTRSSECGGSVDAYELGLAALAAGDDAMAEPLLRKAVGRGEIDPVHGELLLAACR
jgi:WD40 repeat protein